MLDSAALRLSLVSTLLLGSMAGCSSSHVDEESKVAVAAQALQKSICIDVLPESPPPGADPNGAYVCIADPDGGLATWEWQDPSYSSAGVGGEGGIGAVTSGVGGFGGFGGASGMSAVTSGVGGVGGFGGAGGMSAVTSGVGGFGSASGMSAVTSGVGGFGGFGGAGGMSAVTSGVGGFGGASGMSAVTSGVGGFGGAGGMSAVTSGVGGFGGASGMSAVTSGVGGFGGAGGMGAVTSGVTTGSSGTGGDANTKSSLILTMADSIKTLDCNKMCEIFGDPWEIFLLVPNIKRQQCDLLCAVTNQNAGEPLGANFRLKLRSEISVECSGTTIVSASTSTTCKAGSETVAGITVGQGVSEGCYATAGVSGKVEAYIGGRPPDTLEQGLQTLGTRDCSIIWIETKATFVCNAKGQAEWSGTPRYASSSFPSAAWVLANPDSVKPALQKSYDQAEFWALYACDGDKVAGGVR